MTEKPATDDRKFLDHRERTTTSPADVPGAELYLNDLPAISSSRTTPTPGNHRAQPLRFPVRLGPEAGSRRPSAWPHALPDLHPAALPMGDAGRRHRQVVPTRKAGAPEQRQRQRQ